MQTNELVKLAIVGISAGLCISGQTPQSELAMTKCTRTTADAEAENPSPATCHGPNGCSSKAEKPKRAVEGTPNSTMNEKRKSAAPIATE